MKNESNPGTEILTTVDHLERGVTAGLNNNRNLKSHPKLLKETVHNLKRLCDRHPENAYFKGLLKGLESTD